MKSLILVLCLAVTAYGQCPPGNCPPPTFPPNCGAPDCSLDGNRYSPNALFPHPDPNLFWQCGPDQFNPGQWIALERSCACGSVFNSNAQPLPRCTFWFEQNWSLECPTWTFPPIMRPCPPWCPDCNGPIPPPVGTPGPTLPPPPPTPPPVGTPGPGPTPPPGDPTPPATCPCPCPPCWWWPCVPCVASNTCPCNG